MLYEDFIKDVSLKNSITLAKTLYDLFSDSKEFERFKEEVSKYKGNHSMQKFVWNRELDRHLRNMINKDKELLDIQFKTMCTQSDKIILLDTIKESYKVVRYKLHTDINLAYEARTYVKQRKHIYTDSVQTIEIEANSDFEIQKFDLMKLLLDRKYFGILANARLKVPNNNFPNGIETPFDIFNKCVLQSNK